MKRITLLLIAIVIIALIFLIFNSVQVTDYTQITDQLCDLCENRCPEGLECYDFPDMGKRCAEPDPCNYYKCSIGNKCTVSVLEIAMSCPDGSVVGAVPRVSCECSGLACIFVVHSPDEARTVEYNSTGE